MKRYLFALTLLSTLLIFSCHRGEKQAANAAGMQTNDSTRTAMYLFACENRFTLPNYVVIKVKNVNSGETKEVCTEIQSLNEAWKKEKGAGAELNCQERRDRYFEFASDSALSILNYTLYSESELEKYAKTLNVEAIVADVKSGRVTGKTFSGYSREQIMFAHVMFNQGVMMTRGRILGNICGLKYYGKK